MGIKSNEEYVRFFINLQMGPSVTFLSFVNNEKLILKHKLKNKEINKALVLEGIKILEDLTLEIHSIGVERVLKKYSGAKNC